MTAAGLRDMIEGLVVIETAVQQAVEADNGDHLRVYRLRPRGNIQLSPGAIYNVINPSTMEPVDTIADRDTIIVGARVCVRHTDADEEMDRLLGYVDVLRAVFDSTLKSDDSPLGGRQARRLGLLMVQDTFNDIPVLAFEFPIRVRLDALNPPTP